jgi:hypothetical protein
MFKAKNNKLPGNIKKEFTQREGIFILGGLFNFKMKKVRTKKFLNFCLWGKIVEYVKRNAQAMSEQCFLFICFIFIF